MKFRTMSLVGTLVSVGLLSLAVAAEAASVDRSAVKNAVEDSAVAVYPPSVQLSGSADFQNVLAIQTRPDGITVDVSETANWAVVDPAIASWDGQRLTPLSDGETQLRIEIAGDTQSIPVIVSDAKTAQPIRFAADVMPTLTRAGCNTGSCHGAARGKDGFRLSLFGFDPAGDYHRITREMGVRRINLAVPEQSLLLQKIYRRGPPHRWQIVWQRLGALPNAAPLARRRHPGRRSGCGARDR